ncbi:MAG TPA: hypothetical protein VFK62_07410 [Gaiellaceae bacterium]|nr:hypothetical protein [Gaiellaceae bacterium]
MAELASASRRRRRTLPAVGAALAAAVAVTGFIVVHRHRGGGEGPLGCGGCDYIFTSMAIDVDHSGTNGVPVLLNHGSKDARLDAVSFDGLTRGLEILGPLALRIGDYVGPGLAAGVIRGYPPAHTRGDARPVAGFVVHPYRNRDEAVELLIGFRPRRTGTFSYRSLLVHYHVGGHGYVARYPISLTICAPFAAYTAESCAAHEP